MLSASARARVIWGLGANPSAGINPNSPYGGVNPNMNPPPNPAPPPPGQGEAIPPATQGGSLPPFQGTLTPGATPPPAAGPSGVLPSSPTPTTSGPSTLAIVGAVAGILAAAATVVGVAIQAHRASPPAESEHEKAERAWQKSAKTGSKAEFLRGYHGASERRARRRRRWT